MILTFQYVNPNYPFIFLAGLSIYNIISNIDYVLIVICYSIVFLSSLFAIVAKYQLFIEQDRLLYLNILWNLQVYKGDLTVDQIVDIKFKKVGWGFRGAVIRTTKGLNIRIHNFKPVSAYTTLEEFAAQHHIPINKTEHYKILER